MPILEVLLQMLAGCILFHRVMRALDVQLPLSGAPMSCKVFSYRFAQACDSHQALFQTKALAACSPAALLLQEAVGMEKGCTSAVGCTVVSWAQ